MPPKQKLPAPIDRPLSRAYLREFSGWSTAFSPGLSEPTSLRVMENAMVNRDGSLRVRPGLRYLTYDDELAMDVGRGVVGSHEAFFLNDGTKAYLFAVRDMSTGLVGFKVARWPGTYYTLPLGPLLQVHELDDPIVGFPTIPGQTGIWRVVAPFTSDTTYVKFLQIDNKIMALSDNGEQPRIFYVGATKKAVSPVSLDRPNWTVADKPKVYHLNKAAVDDPVLNPPLYGAGNTSAAEATARTLVPTTADLDNVPYSLGYFYTFSNEVGESAPSQVTVIKVRRRWQSWRWETPNATSEPSGTVTDDPTKSSDQIAIYPGYDAFLHARNNNATHLNVYVMMWSDQDPVPVEGTLVGSLPLVKTANETTDREAWWVRHSPAPLDGSRTAPIPTAQNRVNYSIPTRAAQGIVAADRMVLVNDPASAAVIRWTSNRTGEYLNFTSYAGGGYKTLTSGNLHVPACVKLWQNPESKDTITILCLGVDGYSTSYYMAPGQVSSQSDATTFMGFEETTATPGTVSPFGVEVLNNALYHPLETELMKSTASNYNINHKTMTELIENMWGGLFNKDKIVSSQLDNRLYYLVHNRYGAELEPKCWGNEVWVLDTAKEGGSWSRWLVQGLSLRKIELAGQVMMSIVRPEGIYAFNEHQAYDDYVEQGFRTVSQRAIPWKIETNTQGANRAHDAWAHLQQVSVILGNFSGNMRYGVRGYDAHGKAVDIGKEVRDNNAPPADELPWDLEDHLRVARDMKEWHFYAESTGDPADPDDCSGQINLVQYRYTPVSVNIGYDFGSVETFEYTRNVVAGNNAVTVNGIPVPAIDTRRP